jgi:hypothetical protein
VLEYLIASLIRCINYLRNSCKIWIFPLFFTKSSASAVKAFVLNSEWLLRLTLSNGCCQSQKYWLCRFLYMNSWSEWIYIYSHKRGYYFWGYPLSWDSVTLVQCTICCILYFLWVDLGVLEWFFVFIVQIVGFDHLILDGYWSEILIVVWHWR